MVQNWRYRVMTAAVAAPKRLTRTAMAKAPHDRERLRRWLCRSCLLQPLDILPSLTVNNFYVACGILLPFAEFDSPLPLRTTSLNPPLNTIYIILHTKSIYPRRFSNHLPTPFQKLRDFSFLWMNLKQPQPPSHAHPSSLSGTQNFNIISFSTPYLSMPHRSLNYASDSIPKVPRFLSPCEKPSNKFNLSYTRILPQSLPLWHQRSIKHSILLLSNLARRISAQNSFLTPNSILLLPQSLQVRIPPLPRFLSCEKPQKTSTSANQLFFDKHFFLTHFLRVPP